MLQNMQMSVNCPRAWHPYINMPEKTSEQVSTGQWSTTMQIDQYWKQNSQSSVVSSQACIRYALSLLNIRKLTNEE